MRSMAIDAVLSLDLGTTNWKAGLYEPGRPPLIRSCAVVTTQDEKGYPVYLPEELWRSVCGLVAGFPPEALARVAYVGVSGMAEAGLLLDRATGRAMTPIVPWSDPRGLPHMACVPDRFAQTGLPKHSKYSLFKLLALAEENDISGAWWLGVPEYVAWRITGVRQTDPTLAARTYAYHVTEGCWDSALLCSLGLSEDIFPPVAPTGAGMGEARALPGVPARASVSVCGHDHLAAAYALDALGEGELFLSAGTAQVLLGLLPEGPLGEQQRRSGLSFGPSPAGKGWVCLGSIQSAGGSINSWRTWLGLSQDEWWKLAQDASREASPLMYLPYLAGSGAPHLNPRACGALLGLRQEHTREDIVRGVLQGVCRESRWVMEKLGWKDRRVIAAGGLSRQPAYMQALCNTLGMPIHCPACAEATLEGAAMLACGARWAVDAAETVYEPLRRGTEWDEQHRRYVRWAERLLELQREDDDHDDL